MKQEVSHTQTHTDCDVCRYFNISNVCRENDLILCFLVTCDIKFLSPGETLSALVFDFCTLIVTKFEKHTEGDQTEHTRAEIRNTTHPQLGLTREKEGPRGHPEFCAGRFGLICFCKKFSVAAIKLNTQAN